MVGSFVGIVLAELCDLRRQLQDAIKAKEQAERIATQAASELGHCFLKYQQTCAAYNEQKRGTQPVSKERTEVMDQNIHELAYKKWEAAGSPPSDGVEFWLQAETEINAKSNSKKTSEEKQPRKVAAKATSKRK